MTIPHGELVLVAIASANRDAQQFQSPAALDITREPKLRRLYDNTPTVALTAKSMIE